jgi:mannosyltransferase OCH1-like enzyme
MRKFPPAREQNEKWSRAMCSLSSALFIVSLMLLWGSLSISRSSHQLATQQESLLLPGFQQLHHPQLGRQLQGSLLASYRFTAASASAAAAEQQQQELEQQQQEQEQQQQALPQPLVADVPGYAGPPYILPKLIHQTVKDKHSMSCEVQESIQSWIDMNPGYTHILYDDADLLDFVRQHFPDLLPIYQGLPTNIERTDTWRYLVLHKLGGVYADSDVKCMQPISTWNQEHSFDAALMVGIAKRNTKTGDTREFNQFVMAAMPAHPVLATMPLVIAGNLAASLLKGFPLKGHGKAADEAILARTGPIAFTTALEAYARRVGAPWPVNSTQADLQGGVLFGTVRAMPKFVLGTGWDTLDHNMTCEEVKKTIRPEALICHQFFGTWKSRPEKAVSARQFTYGDCSRREGEQQQQQQQLPAATTAAAAAADRDDDSVTMDGGQEPPEDTAAVAAAGRPRGPAAISYTGAAASDDSTAAVGTPEPELLPVLTAAAAAAVGGDDASADTATGAGDVVLTAAVPDDDAAADSATDAAESASPASTTLVQQVVYTAEAAIGAEPAQGVLTSGQAQVQQQQQGQPLSQEQEQDVEAAQQQLEQQPQVQQQETEAQPDEQVQVQEQQLAEQQPQQEQQPLDLQAQAQAMQPVEQQPQQEQQADMQQPQDEQQTQQQQQEQGSWPVEQQPDQQVQVQQEQQRDEQVLEQRAVQQQQQQQAAQQQQKQVVRQQQQEQQQELQLQAQYAALKQQLHHLEARQQQLHHHHDAVPA